MEFQDAQVLSSNLKSGSSRGQGGRTHSVVEFRNWLCAHIRRDDPASRRFLQYLSMRTSRVLVLIRDAKTSRILSSPPANQLWLHCEKAGSGRARKNDWSAQTEVRPEFFEKSIPPLSDLLANVADSRLVEELRQWHFGFNDYYDVYIWDLKPSKPWINFFDTIYQVRLSFVDCLEPNADEGRRWPKLIAVAYRRTCITLQLRS